MERTGFQLQTPGESPEKENYRVSGNFRWLGGALRETEDLCLTVCGIERCRPDKSYGPTVRPDYHVHVVLHGRGWLEQGGQRFLVERGQIFATLPGLETYYYADPSDPWFYTWVSFSGARAAFYMEKAGITPEHPVRPCGAEPEEFLALTEKILDHHQLTVENELLRTALLYEIIALLVRTAAGRDRPGNRYDYSQELYVEAALEYIQHNPDRAQVGQLADYIGISRSYLTRIFQEKLHTSPQAYILNVRMSEASRLLRSTDLPVREIALRLGYENPFSFSQSFKKMFGLSPALYRRQTAGGAAEEKQS